MSRPLAIALLLVTACLATFGSALRFEFIDLDDPQYVLSNPHIRAGLRADTIAWAFTSIAHASNWHPVTWLSHALDVELFGLDPAGHHATSVLLHALNAALVFAFLRRATGRDLESAFAAALFALHPLRVESVAWVAERKDLLSALFGLLAILAWTGYARRGGAARYLAVLALFGLSLMAKPMLVTLPLVLLLLDDWPLRRLDAPPSARRRARPRDLVVEKLPLLLASAACSAVTLMAQHSRTALAIGDSIPLPLRLANAVVSYVRYLGMLAWPVDLAVLYPHPNLPGGEPWAAWQIAGAGLALIAISAAVLRKREHRYQRVGWFWYLGTLVPVIGIVQAGWQAMADRYTYFPSIGLSILVAFGAGDALRSLRWRSAAVRTGAAALAGTALVALAVASLLQAQHWRDSIALYSHAIAREPVSPQLFAYRGNAYQERGRGELALADFEEMLRRVPDPAAYNNAGMLHVQQGDLARGIAYFDRALALDPGLAPAWVNRGDAARDSNPARARADYERALAIDPAFAEAHRQLAWLLAACPDPAVRDGRRAEESALRFCELTGWRDLSCHTALASAYAEAGRFDEAVAVLERVRAAAPGRGEPQVGTLLRRFESGTPFRLGEPIAEGSE
jgi:pentatricopeptide repeat protein